MQLRNPSPIQPPPPLGGHTGRLADAIGCWPGVTGYTHWRLGSPGVVDGAEFHVGDAEVGHIHLDGTAHIPLTTALASLLAGKCLGRTPSWSNSWITVPMRSTEDVEQAAWLFELSYARIGGSSDDEITVRIQAGNGLCEE